LPTFVGFLHGANQVALEHVVDGEVNGAGQSGLEEGGRHSLVEASNALHPERGGDAAQDRWAFGVAAEGLALLFEGHQLDALLEQVRRVDDHLGNHPGQRSVEEKEAAVDLLAVVGRRRRHGHEHQGIQVLVEEEVGPHQREDLHQLEGQSSRKPRPALQPEDPSQSTQGAHLAAVRGGIGSHHLGPHHVEWLGGHGSQASRQAAADEEHEEGTLVPVVRLVGQCAELFVGPELHQGVRDTEDLARVVAPEHASHSLLSVYRLKGVDDPAVLGPLVVGDRLHLHLEADLQHVQRLGDAAGDSSGDSATKGLHYLDYHRVFGHRMWDRGVGDLGFGPGTGSPEEQELFWVQMIASWCVVIPQDRYLLL